VRDHVDLAEFVIPRHRNQAVRTSTFEIPMVDRADLRAQLLDALEGADYPVSGPMELGPALPEGPATTFESGEFSMSVIDLERELDADYPYESAEAFVEDIMTALDARGLV
jgi:hypothetical protein